MFSLVPRCHGCLGVAEVDVEIGVFSELGVLGHLGALVPRQRTSQLLRQGGDRRSDRVAYGLGAMTGESGSVVDPLLFSVAWHGWEVQQHREPGRALHQCSDRGTVQAQDQVAFPVSWQLAVVGLGRSLVDHHFGSELLSPLLGPRPGDPQRPSGPQTRHQFPFEAHPCLSHRVPGRSLRGRFAWTHYGGNRSVAGSRSARGLHDVAHRRSFRGP